METIIRLYKAHQQTLKLRHSEITALPKEGQKSWLQAVTEFLVSQICFQRTNTNTNINISSQRVRDNIINDQTQGPRELKKKPVTMLQLIATAPGNVSPL